MGAVLEGSAKLRSVDGQPEWLVCRGANVHIGVLGHGRANTSDTVSVQEAVSILEINDGSRVR